MGRDVGPQIECFRTQLPAEVRNSPGYRRWMGYAAMLDGDLLIPVQAIDESILSKARRLGVPIHVGVGLSFVSVGWVLTQPMSQIERQAYENMKAHALEAYRMRPPIPDVVVGTFDNERDMDAFLEWVQASPRRASLILEDRTLRGLEFRTSAEDARVGPAAYESMKAHLVSMGVDPKNREWKRSDGN